MKGDLIWRKACVILRQQVPVDEFSMWLDPLEVDSDNKTDSNRALFLSSDNAYAAKWVKKHYSKCIEQAIGDVCKKSGWSEPKVFFRSNKRKRTDNKGRANHINQTNGSYSHKNVRLNKELTFKNFVEGDSNRMAKLMAKEMAEISTSANLFVLCGQSGVGKTHLLHAIVNQLTKKKSQQMLFINAEKFVMDLSDHIINKKMNDFKKLYRSADILLIDDIHFFANKEKTLDEFFHTIKSMSERGRRMVFSCNHLPQYLEGFSVAVQTHLAQGLVTVIENPDLVVRSTILRAKAKMAGLSLRVEHANYIAERIVRSVRDLEGALRIVLFYAKAHRKPIDIPLIKEALKNIARPPVLPISIEDIQREVAAHYNLPLLQLKSAGRSRSALIPRQMAIYLARQFTKRSLSEIGFAFGGRTHTTVIHSCNAFEGIMKQDSNIKYTFLSIRRKLVDPEKEAN